MKLKRLAGVKVKGRKMKEKIKNFMGSWKFGVIVLVAVCFIIGGDYIYQNKDSFKNIEGVKTQQLNTNIQTIKQPSEQPITEPIKDAEKTSAPTPKKNSQPKKETVVTQPETKSCNDSLKQNAINQENLTYQQMLGIAKSSYDSQIAQISSYYSAISPNTYQSSQGTREKAALDEYNNLVSQISEKHRLNLEKINSTCY